MLQKRAFTDMITVMKRHIINDLDSWRNSPRRKPLILTGARQVGKTWALQEFGRTHYKNVAYILFENNRSMADLFDGSLMPRDLLPFLRAESGVNIQPDDTLIIFDEIQAVPNAITSLKFFYEQAPEYSIAAAGSTLGITLHDSGSFPVGKVDFLQLHPMTFAEFLDAAGEAELVKLICSADDLASLSTFHEKLDRYLRQYFYVGGMPEAVSEYISHGDFAAVRAVQKSILDSYDQDFSRHATPLLSSKLRMLWQSIPGQLARENRKFIYGAVKGGARARDFEVAIQWLADSSLVNKVSRVSAIKQPLRAYEDFGAFKLFVHDVGLLGAMVDSSVKAIINDPFIYTEFKGALAEQFVCQELTAAGQKPYYWSSDDSRQEIDFLLDGENGIIPIEVKAGRSLDSPSFNKLMERMSGVNHGYKVSTLPYKDNGQVINLPLYLTSRI